MADPDIVTRLRAVLHNDRSVELMNREAADEIERLRAECDRLARRNAILVVEIDELREKELGRALYGGEG